jgi:hypothetical protein
LQILKTKNKAFSIFCVGTVFAYKNSAEVEMLQKGVEIENEA